MTATFGGAGAGRELLDIFPAYTGAAGPRCPPPVPERRKPDPVRGPASTAPDVPPRPRAGGPAESSGGEHLVQDFGCLVFVSLLGQRQFGNQDLAGLGQHALLAGGQ